MTRLVLCSVCQTDFIYPVIPVQLLQPQFQLCWLRHVLDPAAVGSAGPDKPDSAVKHYQPVGEQAMQEGVVKLLPFNRPGRYQDLQKTR